MIWIIIDLICIKLVSFLCIRWFQIILQFSFYWPFYPPDLLDTYIILSELFYLLLFYSYLLFLVGLVLILYALLLHPLWLHPYPRKMWIISRKRVESLVEHQFNNLCNFRES